MVLHTPPAGFQYKLGGALDNKENMENLIVRPVALTDLTSLAEIDHSYHTDYVWQMELNSNKSEVVIYFREVRLPRSMRVDYPRDVSYLVEGWKDRPGFFVAEYEGEPIGYINLRAIDNPNLISVLDLVVVRRFRRHGVGIALIQAAQGWAIKEKAAYIIVEMQSKNFPGICLANKLGFEFCGYNDHYYANQDIAIFFAKRM
jgi:ribosomal protein S18 acetylase RimI-like enzyme